MATICSEKNRFDTDANLDQVNAFKPRRVSPLSQVSAYGRRILQRIERRRAQRESRDAFAQLLKLDETLLQDIGVTRADVERAAKLPLAEDAAKALYEATGRYRGNRV
ncbi:MAG: DUF1127 domain-containing protein [Granulosicoccus sp.]